MRLAVVKRGGVFGAARGLDEVLAAKGWVRMCGVQSLTYCSIFRLDARDVTDAVAGLSDDRARGRIFTELTRQLQEGQPGEEQLKSPHFRQ
eukprot:gene22093-5903_t